MDNGEARSMRSTLEGRLSHQWNANAGLFSLVIAEPAEEDARMWYYCDFAGNQGKRRSYICLSWTNKGTHKNMIQASAKNCINKLCLLILLFMSIDSKRSLANAVLLKFFLKPKLIPKCCSDDNNYRSPYYHEADHIPFENTDTR